MKKRYLVFSIVLLIFIYGCDTGEKTAADRLAEGNYEDTETDHQVPNDFNSLEQNIDVLLERGNMIGARHYDELEAAVDILEKNGEDVSVLREKLARLDVASRLGEGPNEEISEVEDLQEPVEIEQEIDSAQESELDNEIYKLEENLNILIKDGNRMGPSHFDELSDRIRDLENKGVSTEDIVRLSDKLSSLLIPDTQTETSNQEENGPNRGDPEIPNQEEMQQLPECNNIFFSEPFVDLSKVNEISPLGNIGPPGHTFPTEHTYLHLSTGGLNTKTIPLYAPADVYITHVSSRYELPEDDPEDHVIWFALCKDIIGYFNHVKSLSDEMNSILKDIECEKWGSNPGNSCPKNLLYKIDAGTLLGQVGRMQGNFDFGVMDLSKKTRIC